MEKKSFLKNVLLFLALLIIVSGHVFIQKLSNYDEVWVYNFARCISIGLLPYKDISMIITPLFPMICAVFLKIFGDELIVMRVLEVINTAVILFMIYKILERLKVNRSISVITVLRNILYIFKIFLL